MDKQKLEVVLNTFWMRAAAILRVEGEICAHALLVSGDKCISATPTAIIEKEGYALNKLVERVHAEAVFIISESWIMKVHTDDVSTVNVPVSQHHHDCLECVTISYKTRSGLEGMVASRLVRGDSTPLLEAAMEPVSSPNGNVYNRYLSAIYETN